MRSLKRAPPAAISGRPHPRTSGRLVLWTIAGFAGCRCCRLAGSSCLSMSRPVASLGTFRVWLKTIPRASIKERPTATFLRSVVTPPVDSRTGRSREALANPLSGASALFLRGPCGAIAFLGARRRGRSARIGRGGFSSGSRQDAAVVGPATKRCGPAYAACNAIGSVVHDPREHFTLANRTC
jgi:hypothetical protein